MSGVVGIYSKERSNVSQILYYGLYAIQHRGQISTGIAVNNYGFIDYHKDLGLVNEVFSKDIIERLRGNIGIGHIRYAYAGEAQNLANTQPFVVGYKKGALAVAHDGSIVNFKKLRREMEDNGAIFQTEIDTEVIASLIAKFHKEDVEDAIIKALETIKGSYGMVVMTNDRLVGARDPYGIKPLAIGKLGDDFIIASESCAFDTIGAEFVRDVEPGEVVVMDANGLRTVSKRPLKRNLSLFELIYFARPDSRIDGKSVYISRLEAGKELAKMHPVDADVVIGAPDSGTVAAIGYAAGSGIPYAEGLIKNRYVGRTFIQPTQELREQGVRIKLNPLKENIQGKRVILVDDSIVRGTTMKQTVNMIRSAGAKEIHIRIASPPVLYPCYFGMDTPSKENLIAANMSKEEIRQMLEVESLEYITLEGLLKAVGGDDGYYTGCFTGEYPVMPEE
ncbi:amidophosphoribosyltransferase [Tissierella creatinini]|nr:amidophosphoribosyltransferase [Tissierella creatinini]TJX62929.1 amidophosphoribosyltransferase [Soehngenia saccharolytica]